MTALLYFMEPHEHICEISGNKFSILDKNEDPHNSKCKKVTE